MLDRVARVAALTTAAADRRARGGENPLAEVVDVLRHDYGQHPTFLDVAAPLPTDDRFAALVGVFGLDDEATNLLQIAIAADLDANVALAFDLLGGRVAIGWPSVGLALELAGLPSASVSAALHLHEHGPLRRNGVAEVRGDGSWLSRSLCVPDRIRRHVLGADVREPIVDDLTLDLVAFPSPAADAVARAMSSNAPLVWLRAPFGTAGVSTAAAACAGLE